MMRARDLIVSIPWRHVAFSGTDGVNNTEQPICARGFYISRVLPIFGGTILCL